VIEALPTDSPYIQQYPTMMAVLRMRQSAKTDALHYAVPPPSLSIYLLLIENFAFSYELKTGRRGPDDAPISPTSEVSKISLGSEGEAGAGQKPVIRPLLTRHQQ